MKVLYASVYRDGTGYAHAAIGNILACEAAGLDVVCRPITLSGMKDCEAARPIEYLEKKDLRGVDAVIQHSLPHTFERKGGVRNIGMFAWETTHFRMSSWPRHCNRMDEIWTFCRQSRQAIVDSGVKVPVRIVPHALDSRRYSTCRSGDSLKVPGTTGKMVFYTIGEMTRRKNFSGLLRAYYAAFGTRDRVALLIKTSVPGMNPVQAENHLKEVVSGIKQSMHIYRDESRYPPVIVVAQRLSLQMLDRLHNTGDVFVMPSHGESWCLPAMHAMAAGNAVIVSNWGAFPDLTLTDPEVDAAFHPETQTFARSGEIDCGYLVPGQMAPCFSPDGGFGDLYTGRERWFDPNLNALTDYMRDAYQRWRSGTLNGMGMAAVDKAHRFTIERVGAVIRNHLEEK